MKRNSGFTLVEIMIVVAIIALLAAIAIPNVLRGRTTANESAAVGNMRALMSSLEMYRSVNNVFPNVWTQMTAPTPSFAPPSFAANISSATVVQGYSYLYTNQTAQPVNTYNIVALPQTQGQTGTRAFYVDQSGVLRHCINASGTITSASFTIDAAPNATCP